MGSNDENDYLKKNDELPSEILDGNTEDAEEEEEEKKKKKFGILFFLGILLITMGSSYLGFRIYSHFKSEKLYEEIALFVNAKELKEKEPRELTEIFRGLQIYNPDLEGYIYLPYTPLDYPVVQTYLEDGWYYMRRDFAGWPSVLGTPFADYRTDLNNETDHIIIYGHTADKGDTMFATLLRYKDPKFLEEHQLIELTTKEEVIEYRLIFAISVDAEDSDAYAWTQAIEPHAKDSLVYFENLYGDAFGKNYNYVYEEDDQFLTLISCERSWQDTRVMVVYEKVESYKHKDESNALEDTVNQTIDNILLEGTYEGLDELEHLMEDMLIEGLEKLEPNVFVEAIEEIIAEEITE